jgi:hypothetical protein
MIETTRAGLSRLDAHPVLSAIFTVFRASLQGALP